MIQNTLSGRSKIIYLVRHANTQSGVGESDRQRHLTPKGRDQALFLASELKTREYQCDLAVVSPALRTVQTYENMLDPLVPMRTEERLYSGNVEDYIEIIQTLDDDMDEVMIIGHNPSCTMLGIELVKDAPPEYLTALRTGFRQGQMIVLYFRDMCWADIGARSALLADIIVPPDS